MSCLERFQNLTRQPRARPLGVALYAGFGLLPSFAAQSKASPPPAETRPAASAKVAGLATVSVNVRRRQEDVQAVPTAITTLDGQTLEQTHTQQLVDLQQYLPNTHINFGNPRQTSLAIRGIGDNPADEGLEGSVGVYLDNVYLGRPGMAVFDLLDVAQMELLRGPQGTLFGKNSTAGVLDIQTNKPSFDEEAYLEQSVGNRGHYQTRVMWSGPLSAHWAARATVYKSWNGGFIRNPDGASNKKLSRGHREGLRLQTLYQPDDDFSLRVIADYNQENSASGESLLYSPGPFINGHNRYLERARAAGATDISLDRKANRLALDQAQNMRVQQGGASAQADWKLKNGYTVTSISAFRFWNFTPSNDDGLNVNGMYDYGVHVHDQQYSQELRVASPSDQTVEWVGGLYYFHQQLSSAQFTNYGPAADILNGTPTGALDGVDFRSMARPKTNSSALFGQATWHLSPRWSLTGGVRGTYEEKYSHIDAYQRGGAAASGPALAARQSIAPSYRSGPLHLHGTSPAGLLSLSYQLRPQTMLYASLSHGEKSGGINSQLPSASDNQQAAIVGPERANAAELGLKSAWLERRLIANVDLFWTQINGYQASAFNPELGNTYLTNAGKVRSRGVEWEVKAMPLQGLTLNFNGAYSQANYLSYPNATCPPSISLQPHAPSRCSLAGRPVTGAARWTVNLSLEYLHHLGAGHDLYAELSESWRSAFYGTLDDAKDGRIGAYGLLNLAAGVRLPQGEHAWDISLWTRNLLNKHYFTAIWNDLNGAYSGPPGTPRAFGITTRYEL